MIPLTTPGWCANTLALAVGPGLTNFPGLVMSFLGFVTFSLGGLDRGLTPGDFLLAVFTASFPLSSLAPCQEEHGVRSFFNIGGKQATSAIWEPTTNNGSLYRRGFLEGDQNCPPVSTPVMLHPVYMYYPGDLSGCVYGGDTHDSTEFSCKI